MTGFTRLLLVVGFLVLALALFMFGRSERRFQPDAPRASTAEPPVGRSTLSHGGPGAGSRPDTLERPSRLQDSSNQSPDRTTR